MANDSAAYEYLQGDTGLSQEERYLLSQRGYDAHSNAARKLQPQIQSVKKPVNKPNITMRKTVKKGSAPKIILACATFVLLIGSVIYGKVQTNEVYTEIAQAKKSFDIASSEKVRMKSELDGKMTIKNVEEYAEQVLGLQPLDQSQIEYIQIQTDDIVAIPDEEKNLFVRIKDKFESFLEYLRG